MKGIPKFEDGNLVEGELFPGKWVDDPSCHGLYNQPIKICPRERFMEGFDKRMAKHQAAKEISSFPNLPPAEVTQETLVANGQIRKRRPRAEPLVLTNIGDNDPSFVYYVRRVVWSSLGYFYKRDIDAYIAKLAKLASILPDIPFAERLIVDEHFAYEISRGDWDP